MNIMPEYPPKEVKNMLAKIRDDFQSSVNSKFHILQKQEIAEYFVKPSKSTLPTYNSSKE